MKLEDLVFDDCVIVGYSRDAARGTLTLTFEAFDAKAPLPERNLYSLECSGVREVRLEFAPEFPADLNRAYDFDGNDQRANEIHALSRDPSGRVHVSADMMRGSFHCQTRQLLRVMEIEVGV